MENEPIVFDTTGLNYFNVHKNPEIFLRRLLTFLATQVSGDTFKEFRKLVRAYDTRPNQMQRSEEFLDEYFGKVCPNCQQKVE